MTTKAQTHVIALVTESLHGAELDLSQPIDGNPFTVNGVGEEWLNRRSTVQDLIDELLKDTEDGPEDAIRELVYFAATAVQMWAEESGHDPLALLQQIALELEKESDGT